MNKKLKAKRSFFRTRDGWKLAVYRYQSGEKTSQWGPVVVCHGLGASRYNVDAPDPQISPAKYLHERGHDVWVVELRGAGRSRPSGWPLARRRQFDFDDYVHRDVPAIIRGVLDRTGSDSLHWLGHSMGGMLAYAAMEYYDQKLFRSVITVGSPAFTHMKHPAVDVLFRLRFMLEILPWIPYSPFAKLGALMPGLLLKTVGRVVSNPEQMDPAHVRMLAWNVPSDLPANLMRQFAEWYGGEGGFSRTDGLLDYYNHLDRITAPVLVIAGAGDRLTPVADLRFVFEAISSEDKRFLICGKEQGFSLDYGHIDTILGKNARREVYPHMAEWIESH